MNEEILDIKTPYIKSSLSDIEDFRKQITKKLYHSQDREGNFVSLKDNLSSDTILKQKINNISKKIVGEEIRKFAEVASNEITKEFDVLERRLENNLTLSINKKMDFVEKNVYDSLSLQNERSLLLKNEIRAEFENKFNRLNLAIEEIEKKITNVGIMARENREEISQNISIENASDTQNDFVIENISKEELEKINEYVNKKLEEIIIKFEKKGLLFKKNVFTSLLQDLNVEHFLKYKEDYTDINFNDKEKIADILIGFMDSLEIDPKEDETILQFLRRAYTKEFSKK